MLRKIALIVFWGRLKDPGVAQAKLDFVFMLIVVIPEIGFYIYGNIVFYGTSRDQCKDDPSAAPLWRCCLVILIYGYFYMLYIFGIILFFSAVLCLYKAWSTSPIQVNESDMKNALSQLPIIGNAEMQLSRREAVRVSLLKSADLSTSKDFDRDECAIC